MQRPEVSTRFGSPKIAALSLHNEAEHASVPSSFMASLQILRSLEWETESFWRLCKLPGTRNTFARPVHWERASSSRRSFLNGFSSPIGGNSMRKSCSFVMPVKAAMQGKLVAASIEGSWRPKVRLCTLEVANEMEPEACTWIVSQILSDLQKAFCHQSAAEGAIHQDCKLTGSWLAAFCLEGSPQHGAKKQEVSFKSSHAPTWACSLASKLQTLRARWLPRLCPVSKVSAVAQTKWRSQTRNPMFAQVLASAL